MTLQVLVLNALASGREHAVPKFEGAESRMHRRRDIRHLALAARRRPDLSDLPDELHIHMPPASYWPLVCSAGVMMIFSGLMIHPVVSIAGVLTLLVGIFSWVFEPV